MDFTGWEKAKKGVGSIIGAAFIVLILVTGFSYYYLQIKEKSVKR